MDGCLESAARAAGWGRFPVQEMEEGPALRRGLVRAAKGLERVPSRVVCAKERARATDSSATFAMEGASRSAAVVTAPDRGERRARGRGAELGGVVHGRAYRRHQLVGRNKPASFSKRLWRRRAHAHWGGIAAPCWQLAPLRRSDKQTRPERPITSSITKAVTLVSQRGSHCCIHL